MIRPGHAHPGHPRPRIAVIGAGISGLSAAWLLSTRYDVTLFESAPRAGGHADTQTLRLDGQTLAVDTGFIVMNDRNYPNLTALFAELGVVTQPIEMSFAASIDHGAFEYGGGTIAQLFGQRRNILRPRFWRMVRDILRFYREAPALLDADSPQSLGEFLDQGGYGAGFVQDHILPMGGAIWSASLAKMRDFPMQSFVRFFHNHGLLSLNDRPQWASVVGGSKTYVDKVLQALAQRGVPVRLGAVVTQVARADAGVRVTCADGRIEQFHQAVLACHADQALALLAAPTQAEATVLGAILSADNLAVLHSDASLMPRRRRIWSAWNYLADRRGDPARPVSLTYWMNALQCLDVPTPVLVTLNPGRMPAPALTHAVLQYRHPQFDAAAMAAQRALPALQGFDRLWFAGAWTGWGFHEDGIASAVRIAEQLGAEIPWRCTSETRLAA